MLQSQRSQKKKAGRGASGLVRLRSNCNYGFSGLPCSGLLLECAAFSCGALEGEAFGTGRTSLAGRALLEGPPFGLDAELSRFPAFAGRSFRPTVLLAGIALTGRSFRPAFPLS